QVGERQSNQAARTCGIPGSCSNESKLPLSHMGHRHSSHNCDTLFLSLSFVRVEEKEFVFNDLAADRTSENVSSQTRPGGRFTTWVRGPVGDRKVARSITAGGIVEKVVRRKRGRTIEIKQ